METREIGDLVFLVTLNWVATNKRDLKRRRFNDFGPAKTLLKVVELGDKYVAVKEVFGRKKYYTTEHYLHTNFISRRTCKIKK